MKEPAMHPLTSAPKARPRTEATIVSNEEDFHEVLHGQGDPARPTFAADMTETESAIMSKHVAYWTVPEASGHPIGPSAAAGSPR